MTRGPSTTTLFPYTTLFRSDLKHQSEQQVPVRFRLPFSVHCAGSRAVDGKGKPEPYRSEEHTSELQSLRHLVCRLLLEKKNEIVKTLPTVKGLVDGTGVVAD